MFIVVFNVLNFLRLWRFADLLRRYNLLRRRLNQKRVKLCLFCLLNLPETTVFVAESQAVRLVIVPPWLSVFYQKLIKDHLKVVEHRRSLKRVLGVICVFSFFALQLLSLLFHLSGHLKDLLLKPFDSLMKNFQLHWLYLLHLSSLLVVMLPHCFNFLHQRFSAFHNRLFRVVDHLLRV